MAAIASVKALLPLVALVRCWVKDDKLRPCGWQHVKTFRLAKSLASGAYAPPVIRRWSVDGHRGQSKSGCDLAYSTMASSPADKCDPAWYTPTVEACQLKAAHPNRAQSCSVLFATIVRSSDSTLHSRWAFLFEALLVASFYYWRADRTYQSVVEPIIDPLIQEESLQGSLHFAGESFFTSSV